MSKQSKLPSSPKAKLRTAAEVISRLKWSYKEGDANEENTVMGYDCRINGPLEKCVKDYKNINDGGDIPEHRIQYFRRKDTQQISRSFLWDRASRLDKLFGSGLGSDAPLAPASLQDAWRAERTMQRLAEERAKLAEEKAKRRARQQRAKALAAKKLNAAMNQHAESSLDSEITSGRSNDRHTWYSVNCFYSYDAKILDWTMYKTPQRPPEVSSDDSGGNLRFVTWNVLFDLQRNEQNEFIQGDKSLLSDGDNTTTRWSSLIQTLADEEADVIALQEVTPRFLNLLLSREWVRHGYSSTASPSDATSLQPYGNLTLWKRGSVTALGSYLCRDVGRNRVVVVSLCDSQRAGVLNVANVHLPADQHGNDGITRDRTIARQKELVAVIAKLQVLEQRHHQQQQQLHRSGVCPIPVILGDFNSGDDALNLFHGCVFQDAWQLRQIQRNDGDCDRGFTFDWKLNSRANRTRLHGHSDRPPRRIDRIYVGRQGKDSALVPLDARLLGKNDNEEFPPSDHFGVSVSFSVREHRSQDQIMYDQVRGNRNAWAAAASPTADTLLALVLDEGSSSVRTTDLFDSSSSLPIPHVTLLNGFVDLSSDETTRLATQAVGDVIRQTLTSNDPAQAWFLPVNHSSLILFEHRASATMVCVPDTTINGGSWLHHVYETLRATFSLCHEQESRFADGWTPHLSIASFLDASAARVAIDKIRSSQNWIKEQDPSCHLRAYGLGLFRRDVDDGKFYPVATVPLSGNRHREVRLADTNNFLRDAGLAWSASTMASASIILQDLERACQYTNKQLYDGHLKANISTYGSHSLGVSLPGISDLDTVILLRPKSTDDDGTIRSASESQYLNCVAARLTALHKGAKTRMRFSSDSNGVALFLLTVKMFPQSPSVDVMLCRTTAAGVPINAVGQSAMEAIKDSDYLRDSFRGLQFCSSDTLDSWQVYQGALRIIKLWAVRRQIYGASMGYLGGGGWAAMLLWVLQRGGRTFPIKADTLSAAAQELAARFFENVVRLYGNSNHVIAVSDDIDDALVQRVAAVTASRGSMSVLAPISGGDFGRSTTKATTSTIWNEILLAQGKLVEGGIPPLLSSPFEFCAALCERVLLLRVAIPRDTKPNEIRAWGATQALHLTVALEPEISLRLCSHIIKRENAFWYRWGILSRGERATVLEKVVSEQVLILGELCRKSFLKIEARLSVLTQEEYVKEFSVN